MWTSQRKLFTPPQDYDNINERIKQIEQEAQMIRDMQSEVEKQFTTSATTASGSPGGQFPTLSVEEKMLQDSRSVYVGNVSGVESCRRQLMKEMRMH